MNKRKINHKIVFSKTLLYRVAIIFIQAIFTKAYLTHFSVNDFSGALNISILWNMVNMLLYYIYECLFSLKFDTTVQTEGCVVWFTGLPCSGKSTIADALAERLRLRGKCVERLDGDIVRKSLCSDLGFSAEDRKKNLARIAFVSKLLSRNKTVVLCSFVSPYQKDRNDVRREIGGNFIEVYVACTPEECARRDVKGMWKQAKKGKIKGFTGFDAPYERPMNPQVVVSTGTEAVSDSVDTVLEYLDRRGLV
jgi:adenylyl-sulfate kinase